MTADKATLDLVYEEVRATRAEVQSLSNRMATIEAHQRNVPTLAQHVEVASRLAWHEQSCSETNGRLLAVDEDFEKRLRSIEERSPKTPQQLGAAAGAGGLVAGIIELVRHLASWLG